MKANTKSDPIPVRFDEPERASLTALKEETGLNNGEIIRRACRFSFPKFISGEVKIGKVNLPTSGTPAKLARKPATGAAKCPRFSPPPPKPTPKPR